MNKIKIYVCWECRKEKRPYSGIRSDVRKHLREEHLIKCEKKAHRMVGTEKYKSPLTPKMLAIPLDEYIEEYEKEVKKNVK